MDSKNDGSGNPKPKPSGFATAADTRRSGSDSSGGGGSKPSMPAAAADAKVKGPASLPVQSVRVSESDVGLVGSNVRRFVLDVGDDGRWEVSGKKSKNQTNFSAASKQKGAVAASSNKGHQVTPLKGAVDWKRQGGRGNMMPLPPARGWESAYRVPSPVIPPPLQSGWQWAYRGGLSNASQSNDSEQVQSKSSISSKPPPQGGDGSGSENADKSSDDDELLHDSDEELSDDYDSDVSQKSHETRKKNKWFKTFFEALDKLTIEEINDSSRQWHCPACHDGPGAIDWYKGLQPLMTHAKTKGAQRVKLHRELAELLDEELQLRGTSVIPSGEAYGKWKGLREAATDHLIVWPPMVIIMNTLLEKKDEDEKWLGMGNQELLEYFSSYDAVKARHSYGPHGHRGIGVLIFEASATGYIEAERLHKDFIKQGTDRDAWESRRVLFHPGGKRQLYGFMACKEDMDNFNQHSQGKSRLKFEMRSYQETVVSQMKQMSEDNQQLNWLKNKVRKQKQHEKALEETVGVMSKQLRIAAEENRIVRQRSKAQHEENKEEMDNIEHFFKEKIDAIHRSLEEKETAFEKELQKDLERVKQPSISSGSRAEGQPSLEQITQFIDSQTKGIKEFEAEREKLIKIHEDKKTELKRRYLEEEVELEKEFDATLTLLMEKCQAHSSELSTGC